MQVKAKLTEMLPSGRVGARQVAEALHVSVRSLQRKLADKGTSFAQLLEDTRRELARQYVSNSRLSVGEITYLLGFSDPANFTRAFRRWTGQSPSAFRQTH
jgi:AraC-like DNA-binding protein